MVLAGAPGDLPAGLAALAAGAVTTQTIVGTADGEGGSAVVFPGQGVQWSGMARGLYEVFPVFAGLFDGLCGEFDGLLGGSLRSVVFEGGDLLGETRWAQPALFVVEVALFGLLGGFGLRPDFVLGHSVGELVAAFVAGLWDVGDACRVVAARGVLMQGMPVGLMAVVGVSEVRVREVLPVGVEVAAVNGPESVVVSGGEAAVSGVVELFEESGVRCRRLGGGRAFHSVDVDGVLGEFGMCWGR